MRNKQNIKSYIRGYDLRGGAFTLNLKIYDFKTRKGKGVCIIDGKYPCEKNYMDSMYAKRNNNSKIVCTLLFC